MASISSTHINLAESDRVCLGAHSNKEFVIHAVSKTHTMHYTVSPETRLQAVMDDFCMSSSVLPMSVEFMFNGKNVTGDDSIASLTIEPDDCIDVVSVEATFPTTPGKKTTPTSQSSTKRKIPMKHFMQSPISVQADAGSSSSTTVADAGAVSFAVDMFCDLKKNLFPVENNTNAVMMTRAAEDQAAISGTQQLHSSHAVADMLLLHELEEVASNNKCARTTHEQ